MIFKKKLVERVGKDMKRGSLVASRVFFLITSEKGAHPGLLVGMPKSDLTVE